MPNSAFNVAAWLRRIGYDGACVPTLETLQHLQRLTGKSIACSFFRNQQKPRVSADFGDFFACVYRFGECERFNGGPLGGHADVGVAFEHFLVNVLGEGFHPRMVRPL